MSSPNTTSTSLTNQSVQNHDYTVPPDQPPFDMDTFRQMETVVQIAITGIVSLGGMVTNVINLLVFTSIGVLTDSNTVSLTALAVSDFICCLFVLWSSACLCILRHFNSPDSRWDVFSFYIFSSQTPRLVFTQTTCWLTAYIAIERFVAIVFPFKVKFIFTSKNTSIVLSCIFVLTFGLYYRQYSGMFPEWVQNPTTNGTILTYVPTAAYGDVDTALAFLYLYTSFRFFSFIIIVVCNATMVWKLSHRKFRNVHQRRPAAATTTTSTTTTITAATASIATISTTDGKPSGDKKSRDKTNPKLNKDKRLMRMMCLICTVFIVCFIPDVVTAILFYILPLNTPMTHHRVTHNTVNMFNTLLETINSSSNIFIYYSMSTRYRQRFVLLWGRKGK